MWCVNRLQIAEHIRWRSQKIIECIYNNLQAIILDIILVSKDSHFQESITASDDKTDLEFTGSIDIKACFNGHRKWLLTVKQVKWEKDGLTTIRKIAEKSFIYDRKCI